MTFEIRKSIQPIVIWFAVALWSPLGLSATPLSVPSFAECEATLGQLSHPSDLRPVVKQCGGTCYFESGLTVLDNAVSREFGLPLSISRPDLYAKLTIHRALSWSSKLNWNNQKKLFEAEGFSWNISELGLTNTGHLLQVIHLANRDGVVIKNRIDQEEALREDKVIEDFETKVRAMSQALLIELYNLKNSGEDPFGMDQTKAHFQTAIRSMANKLIEQEVPKNIMTSRLNETALGFEAVDRLFKNPITIAKDIAGRYRFDSKTSEQFKRYLKLNFELSFSHFMDKRFLQSSDRSWGLLSIPGGELPPDYSKPTDSDLGGDHLATIISYTEDSQGFVTGLLVKNSWGLEGKDNKGYYIMTPEYFKTFLGGFITYIIVNR